MAKHKRADRPIRRQRPMRGNPRIPTGASVASEVRRAVEREAMRHRVSRSFIVATILATYFDIDTEDYK